MKQFRVYWKSGQVSVYRGDDVTDAFRRAGVGRGAMPALDYWEEIKEEVPVDTEVEDEAESVSLKTGIDTRNR